MLTQGRTMRATTTRCLKVYIRGGADRQLMARLMADRAHGICYSETLRRALRHYYNLDRIPAPASDNGQSAASAVLLLAAQVRDLTAEVGLLRAEVAAMRRELACALEVVQ